MSDGSEQLIAALTGRALDTPRKAAARSCRSPAARPGVNAIGSRTGPVLPLHGSQTASPDTRGSRSLRARSVSATLMSVRAIRCPRQ
jgi:hypothetical protein